MDAVTPALLDRLADRGWPALERAPLGGWTLRAAGGVTNRANSVLTVGEVLGAGDAAERRDAGPGLPAEEARSFAERDARGLPAEEARSLAEVITTAERWYAARALTTVFQVSPASPRGLTEALAARGYREHSETAVLVATREEVAAHAAPEPAAHPTIALAPTPAWLDTWWSVDGRGGPAVRDTAARILTGVPALYASAGDPAAPDAVARLALVGEWGGLFAVATRPEARRRGHARALAAALAEAAGAHGVERLWLQVVADNRPALRLYAGLGFVPASRYSYWAVPGR